MKILSTILLCMFTLLQINAQQFVDTYIHIRPDYSGGSGELLVMDCEDPNATVTKTVTFDGSPLTGMQATGITASGVKVLHYLASDGNVTYEFEAEINFDPMNPGINYTIMPTVEPMSVIETVQSSSPACDGEIELIVSGGNQPLNFSWFNNGNPISGTSGQTTISNLCAGSYGYQFGDNSSFCTGSGMMFNVTVESLECLVNTVNVSCFGMCDGTADLVVTSQGLGGITMTNLANDFGDNVPQSLTNQCPGNLVGIVSDATGAMAQCFAAINEPDLINFNLTTTDLTSPGANDGTADVNITQGNTPYTYDWSGPNSYSSSGSNQITGLEDGSYTLTMTYNSGQCDTTTTFEIYDALQLVINSVDDQTTTPANGAVNFTISGGKQPYDTIIDDGQTQANGPYTGLAAGQYTLIVTDDRGEEVDSTFTIDNLMSVGEENKVSIVLYPNPASEELNIKGDKLHSALIYDLNGRVVITKDLQKEASIDVSGMETGVYTIKIQSEKGEYVEKLIIK